MTEETLKIKYLAPHFEPLYLDNTAEILASSVQGNPIDDWSEGDEINF